MRWLILSLVVTGLIGCEKTPDSRLCDTCKELTALERSKEADTYTRKEELRKKRYDHVTAIAAFHSLKSDKLLELEFPGCDKILERLLMAGGN